VREETVAVDNRQRPQRYGRLQAVNPAICCPRSYPPSGSGGKKQGPTSFRRCWTKQNYYFLNKVIDCIRLTTSMPKSFDCNMPVQ
jgi:hypothetical protein